MSGLFKFAEEPEKPKYLPKKSWKILIVDDDESVHAVTKNVLKNVVIAERRLELLHAMSEQEAKDKLHENDDIALALVDVIMETHSAGLDLVNYIRNDLDNHLIRLVIRTGQPSEAPEREIIDQYDINDYKEKTELTVDKLYTVIRTSVKQYIQLVELENKYEDVYQQMTTHPLTKLPNRQKLNETLDTEGAKHLVLINIDGFSIVNDTQGFETGDDLLKQMGAFLYSMYADEMQVFHLEGDVFGVLCLDEDTDESRLLGIQEDINKVSFLLDGIESRLSVTMGIAMHEEGNLIQKAEFALKEARSLGRNRASKYSDDIKIIKDIQHNSVWIHRVRDALEDNRMLAYFQPIFSAKTGKVVKYEALVRLSYEDNIILPLEFLACAKNSGQLYNIFKFMFEAVCQKTKEFDGQITINMTDLDLQEPDLIEFMERVIEQYDVDPKQLGVEILEEKSIMNNALVKERLVYLADKGVSIIIDDFGAECSNFGQLTYLPISVIKIDGSFIKDIPENPNHKIIVESVIEFAKKMNIETVAEFVHSQEVLEMLNKMDVTYMQGFYLGTPSAELIRE